jgi:CDP-diacylglycerol--glycerol-3-phosphate 3-phosphatidyltransferase
MEISRNKVFTLSNFFSFLRIFFVVPAIYFIRRDDTDSLLILAFLGMLTDWLDGFLARTLNQISDIGKILDPIADKICIGGSVIAFNYYWDFPLWLTLVILGRDALILAGSMIIFRKFRVVTPSRIPGKIAVFLISVSLIFFILGQRDWQYSKFFLDFYDWNNILVIIYLIISIVIYGNVFFTHHKGDRK